VAREPDICWWSRSCPADKPDPLDGPYFAETIYVTPSRLPQEQQQRLETAVSRGAAALGLQEGPVHAEARLDGDTVVVLEIAARSIGGLCSRALRFGAGCSLEEIILRHSLGAAQPPPRESAASGVLMLPIPRAGTLENVDGLAEARGLPGIVEIAITIPSGQEVVPLPEGDRYLGFAFARGQSPEEVEGKLREVQAKLDVRIHPAGKA
jgi:hypothetical protein